MYKWLQVEASSRCNAWCPGCGRNNGGYGLSDGLILEDLGTSRFKEVLAQLPDLEVIDFSGTFGDAIAAQNILELIDVASQSANKVMLRTNGSLRNTEWWTSLANTLLGTTHEVWFCLDGLAGTHEIYRQATSFEKIIENASAFISAGGTAVWQFIPWSHNEHELKDCIRLSQKLGFKRFEIIRGVRRNFEAKHWQTGQPIELMPWSKNQSTSKYEQSRRTVDPRQCQHLTQPGLYLNASGKITTCCYFNRAICFDSIDQLPNIQEELVKSPRYECVNHCGGISV